jgi:hypothetical protein
MNPRIPQKFSYQFHISALFTYKRIPLADPSVKLREGKKAEYPYERKANDPSRPPLFPHHRLLVCISVPVSLLTQRKTVMQISAGTPALHCIDILFLYP